MTGCEPGERPLAPVVEGLPMMQGQVLEPRRDVSGGYKVDVGRGERVGRVSQDMVLAPR